MKRGIRLIRTWIINLCKNSLLQVLWKETQIFDRSNISLLSIIYYYVYLVEFWLINLSLIKANLFLNLLCRSYNFLWLLAYVFNSFKLKNRGIPSTQSNINIYNTVIINNYINDYLAYLLNNSSVFTLLFTSKQCGIYNFSTSDI